MATQRQERPDLHRVMSRFRMDTMNQIMSGFNVQHIPLSDGERMSKSRSTGAGIRSLNLREFGENAENSGFIMTIDETMHFAEMGVMRGLPAEDVRRSQKARFGKRYVSKWNPLIGETHRPSAAFEMRHLQRRYANFLMQHYEQVIDTTMLELFGDTTIDLGSI